MKEEPTSDDGEERKSEKEKSRHFFLKWDFFSK